MPPPEAGGVRANLLSAIRTDLARSPWTCKGHRKVWARLRALDDIRVARKRLMREHHLLSPLRSRPRPQGESRAADRHRRVGSRAAFPDFKAVSVIRWRDPQRHSLGIRMHSIASPVDRWPVGCPGCESKTC